VTALRAISRQDSPGGRVEAGGAQPCGESGVLKGRPDGEHSARAERLAGALQTFRRIQPPVLEGGERRRSVVDVEEDGVVPIRRLRDRVDDVRLHHRQARVGERRPRQVPEDLSVPAHHRRDGLDDHDLGVAAEDVERGARGETHAEAPDQDPDARLPGQSRAAVDSQLLLGAVAGAVHQLLAVHPHRVAVARDRQAQLTAVAGERPIYRLAERQRYRFLWAAVRASPSIRFRSARKARTVSSTSSLKETFPPPISRSAVTAALLVQTTDGLAPAAS